MNIRDPKFQIGDYVELRIVFQPIRLRIGGMAYVKKDDVWVYGFNGLAGNYEESLLQHITSG